MTGLVRARWCTLPVIYSDKASSCQMVHITCNMQCAILHVAAGAFGDHILGLDSFLKYGDAIFSVTFVICVGHEDLLG